MALIFMDGFDHYAAADMSKKWSAPSGVVITTGRRSGSSGIRLVASSTATRAFSNTQTVIVGAAVQLSAYPALSAVLWVLQDSGTTQVKLHIDASGVLRVYRGSGTTNLLGSSAAGAVPLGAWVSLEFKAKIDPTAGTIDVRVNGVSVLTLTAQNTRATANAYANALNINGVSTYTDLDDLYLCDGTGTKNNDFLGDCRIDALYPNADGTYSQFTPNSGTVHYSRVNEATPDTTTYNDGGTVGFRDSYGFSDLVHLVSQTVYGVQANAAIQKDDTGTRSAAVFARSGTTNADGTGSALSTSQVYLSQVYENDPNGTVAWTESTVNAAEFGVTVTL